MEVPMRRSLWLLAQASAGLVFVACGTDSNVLVGKSTQGITEYCVQGEITYQCGPTAPNSSGVFYPPTGDGSGGGGCGAGEFACPPPTGSGSGSGTSTGGDGSGSGSG